MMRSKVRWWWRLAAFAMLFQGVSGWGSPLPPVMRGAVSANGRFLVVSTFELGEVGGSGYQRIKGQTFEVNTVETFLNAKDLLSAPNVFYSGLGWTVKTKFDGSHLTYWPIVSNDGATLVLVGVTAPWPRAAILQIYRRSRTDGGPVRSFALEELWSQSEIYPHGNKVLVFNDSMPLWFATGSFVFPDGGESLVYTHAHGKKTTIRLSDGSITPRLR